jgi:hypothetical protein
MAAVSSEDILQCEEELWELQRSSEGGIRHGCRERFENIVQEGSQADTHLCFGHLNIDIHY